MSTSCKLKADENLVVFQQWRDQTTDQDALDLVFRGQLSRQEIARECRFAKSVLLQNPRVRQALAAYEDELRGRGVLPRLIPPLVGAPSNTVPQESASAMLDKQRLQRLETENAGLRAQIEVLQDQLSKGLIAEFSLTENGRWPR